MLKVSRRLIVGLAVAVSCLLAFGSFLLTRSAPAAPTTGGGLEQVGKAGGQNTDGQEILVGAGSFGADPHGGAIMATGHYGWARTLTTKKTAIIIIIISSAVFLSIAMAAYVAYCLHKQRREAVQIVDEESVPGEAEPQPLPTATLDDGSIATDVTTVEKDQHQSKSCCSRLTTFLIVAAVWVVGGVLIVKSLPQQPGVAGRYAIIALWPILLVFILVGMLFKFLFGSKRYSPPIPVEFPIKNVESFFPPRNQQFL